MDWLNNCFAEATQRVAAFVQRVVSTLWDDQNDKREEVPNSRIHFDIEDPRSLSLAEQEVVINVNGSVRDQTDVGVSHTTPISVQPTRGLNIASSRSLLSFEVVSNGNAHVHVVRIADIPCEHQTVEIQDPVSPVVPILSKTPQLDTSTALVGPSQSLTDEVAINNANAAVREQSRVDMPETASHSLTDEIVNNANAAVSDQRGVDMSDSASISPLHQEPTPALAEPASSFSFGIENPINLPPEGEETSYGVSSQPTVRAPLPIPGSDTLALPRPVPVSEAEEPNLKIELKVVTWVTTISAGGIVSVTSGAMDSIKKNLLPRSKLLFKGSISLAYIALVFGTTLFILIKIRPNIPGFKRIVGFIMWISIGSLVYSLGLVTCFMFPATVEVVLILVVPLTMVGLVGILSFARRE